MTWRTVHVQPPQHPRMEQPAGSGMGIEDRRIVPYQQLTRFREGPEAFGASFSVAC